MTVARTQASLVVANGLGMADGNTFEGIIAHALDFAITASTDTTVAIYCAGAIPWRLVNNSGGPITVTLYDALTQNGVANDLTDSDGGAVPTRVMADHESWEITGAAGVTWLVIKGSAAASGFSLTVKR